MKLFLGAPALICIFGLMASMGFTAWATYHQCPMLIGISLIVSAIFSTGTAISIAMQERRKS